MKNRLWLALLASVLALAVSVQAQSSGSKSGDKKSSEKKAKSPEEIALEPYTKARLDATKKPDEANIQKMIAAGLAYLEAHGGSEAAPNVVRDLAAFGHSVMGKKDQKPARSAYASRLEYELVGAKYKPDISQAAKTAFAALEAGVADAQVRNEFNPTNLGAVREKVDLLASQPGCGPFLVNAEYAFYDVLVQGKGAAIAEKHLRRIADSSEPAVAEMAQRELAILELRKQPLEFKFTALDGKAVDFAQLRGKAVAVLFFSTGGNNSKREVEALRALDDDLKKQPFEIIGVSFDKGSDKEKLEKMLQDMKVTWPVYFEGNGNDNPLAKKLGIAKAPAAALFDQKGMLTITGVGSNAIAMAAKKLLGVRDIPKDWGSTPTKKK